MRECSALGQSRWNGRGGEEERRERLPTREVMEASHVRLFQATDRFNPNLAPSCSVTSVYVLSFWVWLHCRERVG